MASATDLEKGLVEEHVITHISGMTCTGCERKLQRVLSSIDGVSNLKTTLITGRAEFDIAASTCFKKVVSYLERHTEFKCSLIQNGHQFEILFPSRQQVQLTRLEATTGVARWDPQKFLQRFSNSHYPSGVSLVKLTDRKGREINWDVPIHGSRQYLDKIKTWPHRARIFYDPQIVGARDLQNNGFGSPLRLAPHGSDEADGVTSQFHQSLYLTLLSIALTVPVLIMAWAPLPPATITYGYCSLALATLVQCIVAGPFYSKALKALFFSGLVEMDLLIVLSTTTAYVYSVVAFAYQVDGNPLVSGGFFQTSTLLVSLIMVGRLASAYARRKAADAVSFQAIQSSTAMLIEGSKETLIDVREFQYGDIFKVLPDSIVPTDGIVVSGETQIDESMMTGEPTPVAKFPGSKVIAGSMNGFALFSAQLTNLPIDNTMSTIASMVDEAKTTKPKVEETANRVASYLIPCILTSTVLAFLIWSAVGIIVRQDTSHSDAIINALTYALAVLVVSCPCAIGLAVPMVVVIAGAVGAQHGVFLTSPEVIETARKVNHIIFDKTGTLTQGNLVVVEEVYCTQDRLHAMSLIKLLTSTSKHPVSRALAMHLKDAKDYSTIKLENIISVLGKGMQANLNGKTVLGGNPSYTNTTENPAIQRLQHQGLTTFCLRHGSTLLAIYGLKDALRPDTGKIISALQTRKITVSILSGDSTPVVHQLAAELGIPLSLAKGHCSPEDKANYITALSACPPHHTHTHTGKRKQKFSSSTNITTIFCGDGANDAIALATASIGIHIASESHNNHNTNHSTEISKNASDVILTYPSLAGILTLIDLSRASMRRVYLNFAWCFVYNLCAILLAGGAFVVVRVPPAFAGLGELVSILPVIGVAMSLRWVRF